MKLGLTIGLFLAVFQTQAQQTFETIDVAGNSRTYYQYLPTGYTEGENLPVVIVLHGLGDNALNMSNAGFNQIADTARFIPVYLQGELNFQSQTSWNNNTLLASNSNDILFISSVIDRLEDSIDVDLSRVYCTGFSMGSIMTYTTASVLSDRIAAIACFAGTMSTDEINASGQTFPVPTMHAHGTSDATVPYDGSALPSLSLVQETMDKNKSLNGFAGDSTIINLPDNASDGITIDKIVYNTTTPLELFKVNNADHIWLYKPVNDTSYVILAWNWFSQHQHPNPSTSSIQEHSTAIGVDAYPNPAQDQIQFMINMKQSTHVAVRMLDILGNEVDLVFEGKMNAGANQLNYSSAHLPAGIYFAQVSSASNSKTIKIVVQ